ncbi:hypothetical protein K431DRAFT_266617 [Polychaeton citri CBS 116435]|uniref:C2H2-type domain-containing protein n=1 Tax=Polychaeton citri CBS 116435 TaxID=1314669 RepID=A0A9P4QCQ8_9PEZI|nr:hypothetical protein K431DRAFT_266617 [Polychaeton citri CBS 116435]
MDSEYVAPSLESLEERALPRCYQHGCDGRSFTSLSNYRRHCREKASAKPKPTCERCGQRFTRMTARDIHFSQMRCKRSCLDENGVAFFSPYEDLVLQNNSTARTI